MHWSIRRKALAVPVAVGLLVGALAATTAAGATPDARPKGVVPDLFLVGGLSIADEPPTGPSVQQVGVRVQDMYGQDVSEHPTITVDWQTLDYNAHAPGDYTPASGTLTIEDGEVEGIIDVSIAEDNVSEPTELLLVLLSNPTGGAQLSGIGPGLAFFQINDDEPRPSLVLTDEHARALPDRPRIMRMPVILDRELEDYALVHVATEDVSAVAGVDYLPVSKTVIFPPMTVYKEVWVWILPGDNAGEQFRLRATDPVNVTIGEGEDTSLGTIDNIFEM